MDGKREIKREDWHINGETVSAAHMCSQGEKLTKLFFFFFVMDLLTLLVYPIMFVYGKIYRPLKAKENVVLTNSLVPVFITLDE